MTTLCFTPNLLRHVNVPDTQIEGATLQLVLEKYFLTNPQVRGYVLDDQGAVRKHVTIFINNKMISDRIGLTDAIHVNDDIFIAQALSGG